MPDQPASVLRPSGWLEYTNEEGKSFRMDTLQCVHCYKHWAVKPGSGKIRGFCTRCNGPVCGPGCSVCVPKEQKLDNIEQGRPLDFRPIIASVPNSPLFVPSFIADDSGLGDL